MTLREKIETMQAFERGEYVEVRTDKTVAGQWGVAIDPLWDWNNNDYRIKPKPKQVVVIEKWLIEDCINDKIAYRTVEIQQGFIDDMIEIYYYDKKVKLLDTYKVEI